MFRTAKITVTTNGIEKTYYISWQGCNHSRIVQECHGNREMFFDGDEQRGWGLLDESIERQREFAEQVGWTFDVKEEF